MVTINIIDNMKIVNEIGINDNTLLYFLILFLTVVYPNFYNIHNFVFHNNVTFSIL